MSNKSSLSIGTRVTYCYNTTFSFHPARGAIGEITKIDADGDVWVEWDKPLPKHPSQHTACYTSSWVRPISIGGF